MKRSDASLWLPERFAARPRIAPAPAVTARLEGWLRWELIDRRGRVTRGGEQHNLILDHGLDLIATYGYTGLTGYAHVGTDNTAPAVTDTALGAQVDKTNTKLNADALTRTSNGVYDLEATWEFDFAEANGNLTEWGISPNGTDTDLFSRELFRDTGGSPAAVTKTSSYKLRIVYTITITLTPVTSTAGAITMTGIGAAKTTPGDDVLNGDYCLAGGGGSASSFADVGLFDRLAKGSSGSINGTARIVGPAPILLDASDYTTLGGAASYFTSGETQTPNGSDTAALTDNGIPSYVTSSYERVTYERVWENTKFVGTEVQAIGCNGIYDGSSISYMGLIFVLDSGDRFSKDDLHNLVIGQPPVSWARV